jgi:DNA repair protein RecO (recombination protein O)
MSYLRDRVVILRSESFREHDRRIVMFGREHGLLEAVARGAGSAVAKQAGHVVPMCEADVMIAKGAAFDKLAVARMVEQRRAVRTRLGALAFVGGFFDLFERLQRPGIVDTGLYDLLLDVLSLAEQLPDEPSLDRTRLLYAAAALKLFDRIGFAPALSHCASCRESLGDADAWMLPLDSTLVCADCYRNLRRAHPHAEHVAQTVLALLRFMRREPLGQMLLITGMTDVFAGAAHIVHVASAQAPLSRAPHAPETIVALMR